MTFGSSGYGTVEYGGLLAALQQLWAEQIELNSHINQSLVLNSPINRSLVLNSPINRSLSLNSPISRNLTLNSPTNRMIERTSIIELVEGT